MSAVDEGNGENGIVKVLNHYSQTHNNLKIGSVKPPVAIPFKELNTKHLMGETRGVGNKRKRGKSNKKHKRTRLGLGSSGNGKTWH